MRILVLYDTVEGHTEKIANTIAEQVEGASHEVVLTRAADPGLVDPASFDAAFLCAPIHIGRYPSAFVDYIQIWQMALSSIPTALVTVSLAIDSDNPEEVAEAKTYPEKLIKQTGWTPSETHHAAGALKYVEYNFFKRWMMRRIAEKENAPTDTSQDYELTDWKALAAFVEAFVKSAS